MALMKSLRRVVHVLAAAGLLVSLGAGTSLARDREAGWVNDIIGLRHFSGLRCPDMVGGFYRSKVLSADSDRMAGCIYTGDNGLAAVLRQHLSGTGADVAKDFLEAYKASGFSKAALTGVAQSGISYITRSWTPSKLCETLWHFSGKKADYTLWLTYSLPGQEAEVGPAVAAFVETLNRQN